MSVVDSKPTTSDLLSVPTVATNGHEVRLAVARETGAFLKCWASGGRTWWAHFAFTRINIAPTILRKKIEERRVLCAFASMGECPVAVLWVRRSETNRPSKCLEDTRGELARKGLTHRRMSNDSPKIKWSCQRVNEQVGVGIPRQFSGRDGLLGQV